MAEQPLQRGHAVGRGAQIKPANRFAPHQLEEDPEAWDADDSDSETRRVVPTRFLPDESKTIICENKSPDIPFRYSINPYRGCEHGCAYCYARPGHEYLGMNAGLDFETQILVKFDAARLLRKELNKSSWQCDVLAVSGVTDCYQPAERKFRITRSLLEVMSEANHPVGIVTKNALVARDLDLLAPMAANHLVHVFVSITTLDQQLARRMEPRTATPAARLTTVAQLTAAGVPVGVMVAPIIPGLNDQEVPAILNAAADAGAICASYVLLRLPLSVEPVFRDWLTRNEPLRQERIESLIRSTRSGQLNDGQFGTRMRGTGEYAEQIKRTFKVFRDKNGLARSMPAFDTSRFRRPVDSAGQMHLF